MKTKTKPIKPPDALQLLSKVARYHGDLCKYGKLRNRINSYKQGFIGGFNNGISFEKQASKIQVQKPQSQRKQTTIKKEYKR